MNDTENSQFEVHDREVLEHARSIIRGTESPRMWAQAVIDAVRKNEEWRGQQCINLLAPEAPTSPMVRALLSSEIGTRAAEGNIGRVAGKRREECIDDFDAALIVTRERELLAETLNLARDIPVEPHCHRFVIFNCHALSILALRASQY